MSYMGPDGAEYAEKEPCMDEPKSVPLGDELRITAENRAVQSETDLYKRLCNHLKSFARTAADGQTRGKVYIDRLDGAGCPAIRKAVEKQLREQGVTCRVRRSITTPWRPLFTWNLAPTGLSKAGDFLMDRAKIAAVSIAVGLGGGAGLDMLTGDDKSVADELSPVTIEAEAPGGVLGRVGVAPYSF